MIASEEIIMKHNSLSHTYLYSPTFERNRILCKIALVFFSTCFFTIPIFTIAILPAPAYAQELLGAEVIKTVDEGLPLALLDGGLFGASVVNMGDIDGDGINDVAIGTPGDFDEATANHVGAVWILFLTEQGHVKQSFKLLPDHFLGTADIVNHFGASAGNLGDFDGNGVNDLIVGDPDAGTVWLVTLNADGSRIAYQNIILQNDELITPQDPASGEAGFGSSVTSLGDFDDDGVNDIVVGDAEAQALWVVFLNADMTIKQYQKIDATEGGFTGEILANDRFGASVLALGDLNDDGITDIIAGAPKNLNANANLYGVAWVLFLNADGTVASHARIYPDAIAGTADPAHTFGSAFAWIDEPEGDFKGILLSSAAESGTVWRVRLRADGTFSRKDFLAQSQRSIWIPNFPQSGTFGFGSGVTNLGDLNLDGVNEIAITNPFDNADTGRLWIYRETQDGSPAPPAIIDHLPRNLIPPVDDAGAFGASIVNLGDLNKDGYEDIAVGSPVPTAGKSPAEGGSIWLLYLDAAGDIESSYQIMPDQIGGGMPNFGASLAAIGDHSGDGVADLAVPNPDEGLLSILYLNPNGTINGTLNVILQEGMLVTRVSPEPGTPGFGASAASLGDLNNDNGMVVAIGDTSNLGVWLASFNEFGNLTGTQLITEGIFGFTADLNDEDAFGSAVTSVGDLDGNGVTDIAVGAPGDATRFHRGAVYILLLNSDLTVLSHFKILADDYFGTADPVSPFGAVLTSISDQHFDGTRELAVGIPARGTVALISLKTDGSVNRARYFARTENGVEIPADPTSGLEGFGAGLAEIEDRDGDGIRELAVGSMFEISDEGQNGVLWAINLCPAQACVLPVAVEPGDAALPAFVTLEQNFPNPFIQETTIDFSIPTEAAIHLSLYDVLGREVRVLLDERRPAGRHSVQLKAGELASGLYLYRLVAGDVALGRKMVVGR